MAHLVENMAYFGETPWHGLGVPLEREMSAEEILPHAGLDWTVRLAPVVAQLSGVEFARIPRAQAVVRDGDDEALAVVGHAYEPIQNRDIALLTDAIAGETDAVCHTAGSLDGGRKIWFLLRLKGEIRVPGDTSPVTRYFLMSSAHDGSSGLRGIPTPVRVVCNNTLSYALAGVETSVGINLAHTRGVGKRIEVARRLISSAGGLYARFDAMCSALASAPYSEEMMRELAATLLPAKDEDNVSKVTQRNRDRMVSLFAEDDGTGEALVGTAWGAYQAVTAYADHHRRFKSTDRRSVAENRANSTWFGAGAWLKGQALKRIAADTGMSLAA